MKVEHFDVVVVGGGPGGYVAAIRAAQLGSTVCLVEELHLGGICLNWGCIPTKAMLKSAEVYSLIKKAKSFGINPGTTSFNIKEIVDRSKAIAKQLSSGVEHLLKKNKVTVLNGRASLLKENKVICTFQEKTRELSAKHIIIATGARPREISGLESDRDLIWNYKDALRPKKLPKKLLIVGSGAIGVEFATFYNSLGSETTLVERLPRILPNEDAEVSSFVKKEFISKGIVIHENSSIDKMTKQRSKAVVELNSGDKKINFEVDKIIMAAGIIGNTEGIGLEELGIQTVNGHIKTDRYCRTNIANVYAIGDVTAGPWLAHKASHEGVLVAESINGKEVTPIFEDNIPGCTYCEPQIASLGMSEEKAKLAGHKIKVGKFPLLANGKAMTIGETGGFVKTIFDSDTGELLGAHLVGPEVTELIHSFVIGKRIEGTDEDFQDSIFPHPTLSESIHESVLNSNNRTIHF